MKFYQLYSYNWFDYDLFESKNDAENFDNSPTKYQIKEVTLIEGIRNREKSLHRLFADNEMDIKIKRKKK